MSVINEIISLLDQQNINFSKPKNTQEPPDFYLSDGSHLEVKTFNYAANPSFDVANFDAYTRSLLVHPDRLDVNHLIFGYAFESASIKIVDFWVKKAWEITGSSKQNIL